MCGCSCHDVECMTGCWKCSCWGTNPMFPYRIGQKVKITYPTGTVVYATLSHRGSKCLGYHINDGEYMMPVIQPDGSKTRSCEIEILEEPKIDQPERFGAAVTAGSHLHDDREDWIRTHKKEVCSRKDSEGCYHWRNGVGQMTTWHNLTTPELIRSGL